MLTCQKYTAVSLLAASTLWLFALMAGQPAQASPASASELAPSQDATPILTLHVDGQRYAVSRADIETLPMYEITLTHFEGIEGSFAGVWLDDFLAENDLGGHPQLRFIAHDDYTVFLSREDREQKRFLLATRLDGDPLTLTEFGPSMLIVPEDASAIASGTASMSHWIWSIRDIIAQ